MKLSYLYAMFVKKILLGKAIQNSNIDKTSKIYSGCQIINSSIGKYSYCGYYDTILNCTIGAFCSIADYVYVGGAEHPIDWVSTSPVFENVRRSGVKKRFCSFDLPQPSITNIGNDVWIGHGVSIKQGIKIGDGAVIATGAVVTKDVAPYTIVGGCPAKLIKYRYNKEIIDSLLESKWWNLDDKQLAQVAQYIKEPIKFINAINNLKRV